jgi:hypothetical protein
VRPVSDRFYTTSTPERDNVVASFRYVDEGVAGWVLPSAIQPTRLPL